MYGEIGWTKFFYDGTSEDGLDSNLDTSWSKGRLDSIKKINITSPNCRNAKLKKFTIAANNPSEWHHSDTFVSIPGSAPTRKTRRFERKFTKDDKVISITDINTTKIYIGSNIDNFLYSLGEYCIPISEDIVNKWLVLEIEETSFSTTPWKLYVSEERI